jgi:hypothetical protein
MKTTPNDIAAHGDMTPGKKAALVDALLFGDVWVRTKNEGQGSRFHARAIVNKLVAAGLFRYQRSASAHYAGGWTLTTRGREMALSFEDTESSASRQHFIDTGDYLKYGDREGLNPPEFNVGDTVKSDTETGVDGYRITARRYVPDLHGWLYDVEVVGGAHAGAVFHNTVIGSLKYRVVVDRPPRDWQTLAPVAAQAATLVALGRGDEMVEDYQDGVTTALELLTELVEASK